MRAKEFIVKDITSDGIVTRIDSKPIKDFATNLKAYKHTDDWSQSGVDTGDDSYWEKKNLKVNTTKGLYAGDPHRTALYATGNAYETRYVEFKLNGQPIVYFDKKDLPKIRSRKTYLTVFDASNFKKLPTGEYFSENPGEPLEQTVIKDPFQYIADQGWVIRITDDLKKVLKQVEIMHKSGKISHYGTEGMNENMRLHEFAPVGSGGDKPPRSPKNKGRDPWDDDNSGEDPYSRPDPRYYERSIDFFGRFEADHFDDEEFDKKTGTFKGYWDDEEGRVQIAYFKFDNPKQTGSDDPGMGWYYEPQNMTEDLRKWFKEKWVRFGPDGKIKGDCARGSDKEGKPKCLPQAKAHALGKKGRASAAARKRREDPNPERKGKAINVKTK